MALDENFALPKPVKINNPLGIDWRSGSALRDFQYWDSLDDAQTTIGVLKYEGLTININTATFPLVNIVEYWWKGGTALANLVPKAGGANNYETITAGVALVAGDLVYLAPSGKYLKTDYKDYSKCSSTLRIVKSASIALNATGEAYSEGKVPGYSGLEVGESYFVGVGAIQTQAEIDTDAQTTFYKRSVGTALSTTEFWFQSDNDVYAISTTPAVSNNQVLTYANNILQSTKNISETRTYNYISGINTLTLPDITITEFQIGIVLGGVAGTEVTITPFVDIIPPIVVQTVSGASSLVFKSLNSSITLIPAGLDWIIT